ncbi:MAG: hypothetical protein AAGN82_11565 [Myxococcota bacterium]
MLEGERFQAFGFMTLHPEPQPTRPAASPMANADAGRARARVLADEVAAELGVTVVDVTWTTAHAAQVLRVTIDFPDDAPTGAQGADADGSVSNRSVSNRSVSDGPVSDGPDADGPRSEVEAEEVAQVSVDDCARFSRALSASIDAEDDALGGSMPGRSLLGRYRLEVSSPGADRPLRSVRDYRRQRGRTVKVKLHDARPDGQSVLRGRIVEVAPDALTLDVDGRRHTVMFGAVAEARVVFEMPGAGRSGAGRSGAGRSGAGRPGARRPGGKTVKKRSSGRRKRAKGGRR